MAIVLGLLNLYLQCIPNMELLEMTITKGRILREDSINVSIFSEETCFVQRNAKATKNQDSCHKALEVNILAYVDQSSYDPIKLVESIPFSISVAVSGTHAPPTTTQLGDQNLSHPQKDDFLCICEYIRVLAANRPQC
jgi:hypothetical protein